MEKLRNFKNACFGTRSGIKMLAFLLTLLILFAVLPVSAYADALANAGLDATVSSTGDSVTNGLSSDKDPFAHQKLLYEIVELRDEYTKHFHLEDGSYTAAVYPYPVHYLDENGVWQDIDNSLSESGSELATSDAKIKLAKKVTGNSTLLTLHDGNMKITLSLEGAKKGTVGVVRNGSDSEEETELGKQLNLEKLSSSVKYADILNGVDLEYVISSTGIKENIIIKERNGVYSYSFVLKLNGLSARLSELGNVELLSGDEVKYLIPAPVVYDSFGEYGAASYTLSEGGNGRYTLTVSADAEWLEAEERVYPVTLDPTIAVSNPPSVQDAFIDSANPNTPTGDMTLLLVGSTATAYWKRSNLPPIPSGSVLESAIFTMDYHSAAGHHLAYINAHKVLSDWSESTLTHTTYTGGQGSFDSNEIIDYSDARTYYFQEWDITQLVLDWYENPSTNYGLAFTLSDNTNIAGLEIYYRFLSSEGTDIIAKKPTLTINYTNPMAGVEDYYSYSSQSAGLAGSGSVNLANGNLTYLIPTLSTTDYLMSYTLSMVYNSHYGANAITSANTYYAFNNSYMPYGFKLNMTETVTEQPIDSATVYNYFDADGTSHLFFASTVEGENNVYYDEDGLQKRLTVGEDYISITDDSKIEKVFMEITDPTLGEGWYLKEIRDSSGNAIVFDFDSNLRPTSISVKPAGLSKTAHIYFLYNSSGNLSAIYNPASGDAVILRYSLSPTGSATSTTRFLSRLDVVSCDGTFSLGSLRSLISSPGMTRIGSLYISAKATYSYSQSNLRLETVTNQLTNYTLQYGWNENRVVSVTESAGTESGQSVSFTYGTGYTDVRSTGNDETLNTTDDIITRYIFDDRGRAVAIYSRSSDGKTIYGATVGEYETQENVKNNLKDKTVTGGSKVNYIVNGDFEDYTWESGYLYKFHNWNISGTYYKEARSKEENTHTVLKAQPSAGSVTTISQSVNIPAGDYTLSFLYGASYWNGLGASVRIYSPFTSDTIKLDTVHLDEYNGSYSYSEFSTSFSLSANAVISIEITVGASEDAATNAALIIDNVSLTQGIGASSHNYVELGGFEGMIFGDSDFLQATNLWNGIDNVNSSIVTGGITESALRLKANNGINEVKQRIYTAPTLGVTNYGNCVYLVSGFAKAENALHSEDAKFRLRVDVHYYQGEGVEDLVYSYYIDFAPGVTDWQFVAKRIDLTELKKKQEEALLYQQNPNISQDYVYNCVSAVDIVCEYSGQANGYAYFDNISAVGCYDYESTRYSYYPNGLLATKSSYLYTEYYEYNDDRNLTRVANNKGELTDYKYKTEGDTSLVERTVVCDFTYMYGYNYPFYLGKEAANAAISVVKIKVETTYTYNAYGQLTETNSVANMENSQGNDYQIGITTSSTYETTPGSKIFGATLSTTDAYGSVTRCFYDEAKGYLLATVNENENVGTCYTYDSFGNLVSVMPAEISEGSYTPVTDSASVEYTYNGRNLLSSVTTESTTYNFTYDAFGNSTATLVGDSTLATYEYYQNNGKLFSVNYGNGFSVEYLYNSLELVSDIWYNYADDRGVLAYSYEYDAEGRLYKFTDHLNQQITLYTYDSNGRVTGSSTYDSSEIPLLDIGLIYDDQSRVSNVTYNLGGYINYRYNVGGKVSYGYNYDHDGSLSTETVYTTNGQRQISYTYDGLDRLTKFTSTASGSFTMSGEYIYRDVGENLTGAQISQYKSTVADSTDVYSFEYDVLGNITKVIYNSAAETRYVYDELNQLVREDNGVLNKTFLYTYDNAGNILKKEEFSLTPADAEPTTPTATYLYGYGNSQWGDQMTSFDGHTITYDEVGNPINYYNGSDYTFTWTGRRLTGATYNGKTLSFVYNDDGIRTSKTVNGVTTAYILNGSTIVGEITGDAITMYFYDASGSVIGMQYHGADYDTNVWDIYWFEKNLQGDIVAVWDNNGTKLVSYTYDAWGNHTTEYHNGGADTYVANNPFRYRGYYYDSDLDLYYLNARYYDSNTCRFISADGHVNANGDLVGFNMYAYCSNNPVMYVDPTGEIAWWAVLVIVVAAVMVAPIVTAGDVGTIALTAATVVGVEHSINAYNEDKIEKELEESYTAEDAEKAINDYLGDKYGSDVRAEITENGLHIANSCRVNSRYDRQYVCSIYARTGLTERSVSNLSAEWLGHNFVNYLDENNVPTISADLDKVKDKYEWIVKCTKVLEIMGIE